MNSPENNLLLGEEKGGVLVRELKQLLADLTQRSHVRPRTSPLVKISDSGCWEWQGQTTRDGYGVYGKKRKRIHRIMYTRLINPIEEGLVCDHLCRNRICCNPLHLEIVTGKENVLRGIGRTAIQARQTHCKRNHEFTFENTIRRNGTRSCRICKTEMARLRRRNKNNGTCKAVE